MVSVVDAAAFASNMLFEMARMSADDGLVMQIHPGVLRGHDPQVDATFGPDVGFDIPLPVDFVRGLRPLLQAFGRDPHFHCVVFTIDETAYSRELAPLAGVYPAMRLGVPWWFLNISGAADNALTPWMTQRLGHIERVLGEREWLAGGRFTVADLLMADVLRVPKVRAFGERPRSEAYVARVTDRPAFRKAYADQMKHFEAADRARV